MMLSPKSLPIFTSSLLQKGIMKPKTFRFFQGEDPSARPENTISIETSHSTNGNIWSIC